MYVQQMRFFISVIAVGFQVGAMDVVVLTNQRVSSLNQPQV